MRKFSFREGGADGHHTGREAHYTPAWVVDALLEDPACPLPLVPGGHWVDAGAGDGALHRAVSRHMANLRWTLVEPYAQPRTGHPATRIVRNIWVRENGSPVVPDALVPLVEDANVVISNPPFSLAVRFVLAARAACPDATIVLLQRLGWLDEAREGFFRAHIPDVYVLPRRVAFLRPTGGEQPKMAGLCAWFVWEPEGRPGWHAGTLRLLQRPRAQEVLL